jgi:four helix bundle protein
MKAKNVTQQKCFYFSVRIIKLYKFLTSKKKEFVLSKQILRSGTSIGANIEEAIGGQSKNDFIAKLSIAHKEARETMYWLELLIASDYLDSKQGASILKDCDEILRITGSAQITARKS